MKTTFIHLFVVRYNICFILNLIINCKLKESYWINRKLKESYWIETIKTLLPDGLNRYS